MPGGTVQQGYDPNTVKYVNMNDDAGRAVLYNDRQVKLKYIHNGIDITGSGSIKSPGYYKVILKDGHRLTLERIGTDRHTTIRHLIPSEVSALPINKIFKQGDNIISYPSTSVGPGSNTHIHVEETRLSGGSRVFCNPDSHTGATSGMVFYGQYIIKNGNLDQNIPNFGIYKSWPSTRAR